MSLIYVRDYPKTYAESAGRIYERKGDSSLNNKWKCKRHRPCWTYFDPEFQLLLTSLVLNSDLCIDESVECSSESFHHVNSCQLQHITVSCFSCWVQHITNILPCWSTSGSLLQLEAARYSWGYVWHQILPDIQEKQGIRKPKQNVFQKAVFDEMAAFPAEREEAASTIASARAPANGEDDDKMTWMLLMLMRMKNMRLFLEVPVLY